MEETLSMSDFEEEISRSFQKIKEGDIVSCTILDIKDTGITVDIGTYLEGIIPVEQLSSDPRYNFYSELHTGDSIKALVIEEDNGEGSVILSKKQADNILSWDLLKEYYEQQHILHVTCSEVVNGGMVTYVDGVRGFIPASQLSTHYVEDLESWKQKQLDAVIITLDPEKHKLVLSAKQVEKAKAAKEQQEKIAHLQKGIVTVGIIEKIVPYGAFVRINDELTGLVHISQICGKHIKSPNEVVKEGQEVTVKIIDIHDGKISLSMKSVSEQEEVLEEVEEACVEYISDESASTGLGSLLSKLKF